RKWSEDLYGLATKCSQHMQKKYGKTLEEIFPQDDYQLMHFDLFPEGIIHAECIGGDIDQLSNQRTYIGAFPWRAIELESCICRIVAFPDIKE
ncbi:MAG TPA: cyclase family protein, partial [Planctomycetota bacterium]|nr:cyclase family protein [Planctomycetota bacterium]